MFEKLRNQLLFVFLLLGTLNVVVVVSYVYQLNKQSSFDALNELSNSIEILVHKDIKHIHDFFTYETHSVNYFITQSSHHLRLHQKQARLLDQAIQDMKATGLIEDEVLAKKVQVVEALSDSMLYMVDSITSLIIERGFKDYGAEGMMRVHAHHLERKAGIPFADLLMLRRLEKDYIIRSDPRYVEEHKERSAAIIEKVMQDKNLSFYQKNYLVKELKAYEHWFGKVVDLDSRTGVKTNTALKAQIDLLAEELLTEVQEFASWSDVYKVKITNRVRRYSILILILTLVIGVILSIWISNVFTRRITILSDNISRFIGSQFLEQEPIKVRYRQDEVGKLIGDFEFLKAEIAEQFNQLEVKVYERTEELNLQKEILSGHNVKMRDSLNYAKQIQEAVLPNERYIQKTFPEHFIFFQPRDIVSGDFYWFKRIQYREHNLSILAVADCTGHGVPGGFMSMLGISFLNDLVSRKDVDSPAYILNQLREKVIHQLTHHDNYRTVDDGMDIALVVIDHDRRTISYSGAFRDLYLIRDMDVKRINGDRMPIGKFGKDNKSFTQTDLLYEDDDMLYLFTDGMADQIGGASNKKFMRKRMQKLMEEISELPIHKQREKVHESFFSWKGLAEQTDDVLFVGFRL